MMLKVGLALALTRSSVYGFNENYDSDVDLTSADEENAQGAYLSCFHKLDKVDQALVLAGCMSNS
jgi:hypothetical protein